MSNHTAVYVAVYGPLALTILLMAGILFVRLRHGPIEIFGRHTKRVSYIVILVIVALQLLLWRWHPTALSLVLIIALGASALLGLIGDYKRRREQ